MKAFLFIVFLAMVFKNSGFTQDSQRLTIINASKAYYNSLTTFYVEVKEKAKTSIAEDTSVSLRYCFIKKSENSKLFLSQSNVGMFVKGDREYVVYPDKQQFERVRSGERKFYIYQQKFKYFPFINYEQIFKDLVSPALVFTQTDSSFVFRSFTDLYELRKFDYSVQRISHIKFDPRANGNFVSETQFGICIINDSLVESQLTVVNKVIAAGEQIDKNTSKELERPTHLDFARLGSIGSKLINSNLKTLENKTILFDFFYQSCFPCVRSIPGLSELYLQMDSNFTVVGVDTDLSDTMNIEHFLERYNIKYPVITGPSAVALYKNSNVLVWPTFILVAPTGEILEWSEGESASFLNKIKRKYLKRE